MVVAGCTRQDDETETIVQPVTTHPAIGEDYDNVIGPSEHIPEPPEERPSRSPLVGGIGILDDTRHNVSESKFGGDPLGLPPIHNGRSSSQSPLRLSIPAISPAQLSFSALQYLPVPAMVLNGLKTVVLANEAMGRLIGVVPEDADEKDDHAAAVQRMRGQTLSQVGIDMLQDGRPVWVTWEAFLDELVHEMGVKGSHSSSKRPSGVGGDATPTVADAPSHSESQHDQPGKKTRDAVVEVVISRKRQLGLIDTRNRPKETDQHISAKMIITIWEIQDGQNYFTLTFTNTQTTSSTLPAARRSVARPSVLEAAERRTIQGSNPPSVASSRDSSSPSFYSPGPVSMSSSPFPPMGPPTAALHMSTPSLLQKMIVMKDALLDNTEVPILAMWKDGSAAFPNKAARKLFGVGSEPELCSSDSDLLEGWHLWTEDFSRKLEVDEFPISVLLQTETPFPSFRLGVYDADGEKRIYDVLGEVIRDDATGQVLAGVVTWRDVTVMSQEITQIKEKDEERFRLICDTMPQLVWTATPDGMHDFFNDGWYQYTGLTPEESIGMGWRLPFHPDDMAETTARWQRSLKTGEPYVTEYRCRRHDGEWRWFLGRALAVRNKDTGEVEKWFGTCTDVHESIATKLNAKRTREQLLSVIAHSHVTLFTVDRQRRVTMLEGALIWNNTNEDGDGDKWFIGQDMYTVFNRLTEQMPAGERPMWLQPIEDVLEGRLSEDAMEHSLDDRWYRTRFLPMSSKAGNKSQSRDGKLIEGVIGLVMDVTELKNREAALQEQSKEKRKAVAAEGAAKEANRLKSQFLANMSHEIRTPITGVLGMAELLGGMELDEEQRDYVDNIHSSATSLLTVINDILDFSKVESGRLDIEEVQFSLSVIVKEVVRMLQFAVERKNLDFRADIGDDVENDMVVIGDPGRVRQIITNLLTNSIKFTNQGYVRFSVRKEKETADSVEVKFVVEDTGIGIQSDVRKKLFQPFSQGDASTARRFGGTGLGLTICKNLLGLMRGNITLESVVGNGTTATFYIPFAKPQGPRTTGLARAGAIPDRLQSELSLSCNSSEYEQVAAGAGVLDGADSLGFSSSIPRRRASTKTPPSVDRDLSRTERAKMHVLVVEDNPVNQKIATKTIQKLGFQVKATWNGKEALEYLIEAAAGKQSKPDIILMDVQMPIIDGYKCTHLLRHHAPYKNMVQEVPIVAMTASAIQGDREKCTKAGMDDYLAKPVTKSILERMLVKWGTKKRRPNVKRDNNVASDCSEMSENCDNADIPSINMEEQQMYQQQPSQNTSTNDTRASPNTPRPLTANGVNEPSPFDSPLAPDFAPQVRRPEGEKEWSSLLQENKLIDAAGGPPTPFRSNSYQDMVGGEALTEENVNKLADENQIPRR